jgi:hypothetical protein
MSAQTLAALAAAATENEGLASMLKSAEAARAAGFSTTVDQLGLIYDQEWRSSITSSTRVCRPSIWL